MHWVQKAPSLGPPDPRASVTLGLGGVTLSRAFILSSIYSYTLLFCTMNYTVNFLKIESFVNTIPTDNNSVTAMPSIQQAFNKMEDE